MPCFRCIQRLDPFQFLPFLDMPKRAKDVLGRPDWIVGIVSVGTESVGTVSASLIDQQYSNRLLE